MYELSLLDAALKYATWRPVTRSAILRSLRHGSLTSTRSPSIGRLYYSNTSQSPQNPGVNEHATVRRTNEHISDVRRTSWQKPEQIKLNRAGVLRSFTLDPRKLTRDHFLDLVPNRSGSVRLTFRRVGGLPGFRRSTRRELQRMGALPRCLGFFYYHLPPNAPLLAGEICFRLTGSPDPALFPSSPDLHCHDGLPWRLPLVDIVRPDGPGRPKTDPLLRVLLADGLVSHDLVRLAKRLVTPKNAADFTSDAQILYAFQQPFLVRFNCSHSRLWFAGEDRFVSAELSFPPVIETKTGQAMSVFRKGSAWCCFEKSEFPEHKNKHVIVLRVLRVLEPVAVHPPAQSLWGPDLPPIRTLVPREGELLRGQSQGEEVSWSIDVGGADPETKKALRVLYDNEAYARSSA